MEINLFGILSMVDIAELDCIYLTYDEPKADEFWAQIQANIPWAKRVHGVKGSDAAHKAAANASDTDRFILIDGDNLPRWEFFNQELILDDRNHNKVFRWRSYNVVNGLCYGNGGISSWTKDFALNMCTHENTDGSDETSVEFCFDKDYWAMHDVWSTTYPNQSAKHAWRAGFREGVKLCLDKGKRVSPIDFEKDTWHGNRHNLEIWCSVGADVEHGHHAMLGARQGAYMAMFDDEWNYAEVRDFDALDHLWASIKNTEIVDHSSVLKQRLGLNILDLDAAQSAWFKRFQHPYENIDIMLPEHEYRRVLRDAARQV
jgi:hypothetical protein